VDAYFSARNFQTTHKHKGKHAYPDFHSMVDRELWKTRVLNWSDHYVNTYTTFSNNCTSIKHVFYDEMVKNPWKTAKKLVKYIDADLKNDRAKECVSKYGEGNMHRMHDSSEHDSVFPVDLFTENEKARLDSLMTRFNQTLRGRLPQSYSFYTK